MVAAPSSASSCVPGPLPKSEELPNHAIVVCSSPGSCDHGFGMLIWIETCDRAPDDPKVVGGSYDTGAGYPACGLAGLCGRQRSPQTDRLYWMTVH